MGEIMDIEDITKVSDDRVKKVREKITKKYGADSLVDFNGEVKKVPAIPTGSLKLDRALGIGGWPRNRIVNVYGGESSSKTTMALHAIANVQKMGGLAAFIDFEATFDPFYANSLGVDLDKLLFAQPESAEEGLQILQDLVETGELGIGVVDSVAAITVAAERQNEFDQASPMGGQARLMGMVTRKLSPLCKKYDTMLFFINQIRSSMNPYGPSTVQPGGRALPFAASVMVELKKKEKVAAGKDDPSGNVFLAKVVKNKVAPPFRECTYEVAFGEGVVLEAEILDLAEEFDFIQKGGAWYTIGEERFQGKPKAVTYLKENPDIANDLEQKVREKLAET
jgi:recombination protein RecA